jgi:BNR/Asp-box repeat./Listeria-Bacteroides repeat domain (List_Bact_rpt).
LSQTILVGTPVTFAVAATGSSTLGYQWQKGGVNVTNGTGDKTNSYTISSIANGDAGSFTCVVTDACPQSTTSNAATLTVAYSVTYNGNSNTGGSVPTDGNPYTQGTTVTVKANTGTLVKTGYAFSGWNTATDGSGTTYVAGTGTFAMGSNNVILYAKWTALPAAPILVSPSSDSTLVLPNSTFSWNTASNAVTYNIQIANNSAFTSPVVNSTGITTTTKAVTGLSNSTKYYWRVSGTNTGGQGPWTTDSFTTLITWTAVNNGLSNYNVMAFAVTNGNVFAATDGGVYITTDNGNTWANTGTNGLTNLNVSNIAANGKNIFANCGSDGVFNSIDNGAHWSLSQVFPDVVEAIAMNGTTVFVGTLSNGVYYSTNNGTNWTHPDNNGLADAYGNVYQIHNLAINGSYLYTGTQGGGVMYSVNNGESWTEFGQINSGTWINSLGITNGGFYAGTYSDGLYFTQNNGSTWTHALPNKNIFSIAGLGSKVVVSFNQAYSIPPDSLVYSPDNGNTWCNTAIIPVTGDQIESSAISGDYIFVGTGLNGIFRSPLP